MRGAYRVGVDIGGTFTDVVVSAGDGSLARRKILSTPAAYADAVIAGTLAALDDLGIAPGSPSEVIHATTVATNAILERKGGPCAVVTTAGFRDVLEIGRLRMPELYNLFYDKRPQLVPRRHVFELAERIDSAGRVVKRIDKASLRRAIAAIKASGVPAVAVCLINSHANPAHERAVAAAIRKALPALEVSVSADILPRPGEYERTSTTVIDAYVKPLVRSYLGTLAARLRDRGVAGPLFIMQCGGGLTSVGLAAEQPVTMIESGPAAGVLAARHLAQLLGLSHAISFDMGGTTAKASIIEHGAIHRTTKYEVGGRISATTRLTGGGGYPINLPVIDVAEVGAGGGSIAWLDRGASLRVGPHSAEQIPDPPATGAAAPRRPSPTPTSCSATSTRRRSPAAGSRSTPRAPPPPSTNRETAGARSAAHGARRPPDRQLRDDRCDPGGDDPARPRPARFRADRLRRLRAAPRRRARARGRRAHRRDSRSSRAVFRARAAADGSRVPGEPRALSRSRRGGDRASQRRARRAAARRRAHRRERVRRRRRARLRDRARVPLLGPDFRAPPRDGVPEADAGRRRDAARAVRCRPRADLRPSRRRRAGRGRGGAAARAQGGGRRGRGDREGSRPGAGAARRAAGLFRPRPRQHRDAGDRARRTRRDPRPGPLLIEEYNSVTVVPPGCTARRHPLGPILIAVDPAPGAAWSSRAAARRDAPAPDPVALAPDIDPIRFELIRNAMSFLVNEMALTLVRASYSGILRDNMDFSTGLADPAGEMIGQGLSLPLQFGPIPDAVAAVKARWAGRMEDGDVFVLNDPFEGGTHLPDVFFIKPIYLDGGLLCFACVSGHQVDVGGRVAGSNACDSTEIYAEGLRLPPVKLYERGRPNETLFAIIEKNVRVPVKLFGDFRAQVSALRTGENGVLELVARYGRATLTRYWAELLDHGERMTRAAIRELPEGTYRFEDWIDSDGLVPRAVPLRVAVTIRDGGITVDWTGSSPQVAGAINSTISMTKSTTYFAVRSILRGEIPGNGGFFRPIKVVAEKGSILDAELPAASAGRGVVLFRQSDALFGALAKAVPDRVPAANEGGTTVYGFGGYDADRKPFVLVEVFGSTWGGRPDRDGLDGCAHPLLNQRNIPIEIIELEHPLLVRRYGFLENTGGAGRFRGGLSLLREIEYRGATPCQLQIRSDRVVTMPYGLAGGREGTRSWNILDPGTARERLLPAMTMITMAPGEVIRFVTPGGGGWGDPLLRDPQSIRDDVRDGKLDAAHVRRAYGVVVDDAGELDPVATERLRAAARRATARGKSRPPARNRKRSRRNHR